MVYLSNNYLVEIHVNPIMDNEYIPSLTAVFHTYYDLFNESIPRVNKN